MLQYHFNWKVLSALAGITWWNFYFRLYQRTIRAPQVVDFLAHLLRHLPGRLLVIWDRSKTHRSRLVGEFVAGQRGRLALDYLPAYAPELNPVEYIWGYWKHHELPNFCPHDFSQLSYHARHTLRRMRRRPTLVMAFWEQRICFLCNYIMQSSIGVSLVLQFAFHGSHVKRSRLVARKPRRSLAKGDRCAASKLSRQKSSTRP